MSNPIFQAMMACEELSDEAACGADATCAWGQGDARLRRLDAHGAATCSADVMKVLDCTYTQEDLGAAAATMITCAAGDNTTCGNATAGFGECALGENDMCATTNALALQMMAPAPAEPLPEAEMMAAQMAMRGCDAEKVQQLKEMETPPETEEPEMADMPPLLTGLMTD